MILYPVLVLYILYTVQYSICTVYSVLYSTACCTVQYPGTTLYPVLFSVSLSLRCAFPPQILSELRVPIQLAKVQHALALRVHYADVGRASPQQQLADPFEAVLRRDQQHRVAVRIGDARPVPARRVTCIHHLHQVVVPVVPAQRQRL